MRTEIKEFIIGSCIMLIIGYLWHKLIEPSSFWGWILIVIITYISFAIFKVIFEKK